MRKFVYRLVMVLMIAVAFTCICAAALTLLVGGDGSQVTWFVVGAIVAGLLMLVIANANNDRGEWHEHADDPFDDRQLTLARRQADRPVMTYKGQVYDFVHNDPTAPDLA